MIFYTQKKFKNNKYYNFNVLTIYCLWEEKEEEKKSEETGNGKYEKATEEMAKNQLIWSRN